MRKTTFSILAFIAKIALIITNISEHLRLQGHSLAKLQKVVLCVVVADNNNDR